MKLSIKLRGVKLANSSFIAVPQDVTDATELKRFLDRLVVQLDTAFGHRGEDGFVKESAETTANPVQTAITSLAQTLVSRGAGYVQSEAESVASNVQSVSSKVNEIIAALKAANITG